MSPASSFQTINFMKLQKVLKSEIELSAKNVAKNDKDTRASALHKTNRRKNPWGDESYMDLISNAISSNIDQKLTLQGIYDWIIENNPYFASRSSEKDSKSWKNSVRHNLSLHGRFQRVANSGHNKGSYWILNNDPNTMNLKKCPKRPYIIREDERLFGKSRGRPFTARKDVVCNNNNQPVCTPNQINDSGRSSLFNDNIMQRNLPAGQLSNIQPISQFEVPQYGYSLYEVSDPTCSFNECRNTQLAAPSAQSGLPQATTRRTLGPSIQPRPTILFDTTQPIETTYIPQHIEPKEKTMDLLNERSHPTTLTEELAVPHQSNNEEYFPDNDDVCVMDDGSVWRLVSHTSTRPQFKGK